MFLNLSAIAMARIHPTRSLAISFIDLKGDISIKQQGRRSLATNVAGLDPIDRPNIIMSDSSTPNSCVR